ncbi:uncharacterized protein EDB91DRAFT_1150500 [Suillus paluster]|uniref:uncharacterized protein n=1 Tax=Suillus paluster TaxID=48578 RepID=UPI001B86B2EC|nr:uncharacterized protein EDB91DRAFT_1150500 [Suillus paluster]KAG1732848.1 hypothetical protein EDB91DRAFT_1150500 [Suillus paluster]
MTSTQVLLDILLLPLVGHEGRIQDEESAPIRFFNKTACFTNSPACEARPDVICVAHSHTTYGMAFGTLRVPLDPITQDNCAFYEVFRLHRS